MHESQLSQAPQLYLIDIDDIVNLLLFVFLNFCFILFHLI